jgi:tRNA-binding protein
VLEGVAATDVRREVVAMATVDDFLTLDIRVGTVIAAEPFPEARKPAIKLRVDFGPELGVKRSSAQLTAHYTPEQLIGRQVVAVVNFPLRRIAGFESEVLVLGAMPTDREVILLAVDRPVDDGTRIG